MEIRIRPARKEDVGQMARLIDIMNVHHVKLMPDYFKRNPMKYNRDYFLQRLVRKNGKIFVADTGGKVAGLIYVRTQEAGHIMRPKFTGYISRAVVDPKYRHRGIATMLMGTALYWLKLKKIKFVLLHVETNNKVAVKAWEKMGFKEHMKEMMLKIEKR